MRNKIKGKISNKSDAGIISFKWENVREIPSEIGWFENVWKEYSEGKVFR